MFADMTGIIPLDEEEEEPEQEVYDDVGGEDIYEVLPGLAACLYIHHTPAQWMRGSARLYFKVLRAGMTRKPEVTCFLAHSSLSVQRRTCPPWPRLLQKQS